MTEQTPKKKNFVVKESKFFSGVKRKWRFPRGKHSKVRQMHKGRPALPNPGFGSPKSHRDFQQGLPVQVVHNITELPTDVKIGVILSATLGQKKKLSLLKAAQEKKLTIINVKDPAQAIANINKVFTERQAARKLKLSQKDKKQSEKKKQAEAKKSEKKPESVEDKINQNEQKKQAEKTITKKQ
jgi:large subunit ribosomal protein L32e